jgi:gas vesicle structural protein
MARRTKPASGDRLFPKLIDAGGDEEQPSLVDVLDNVLNRGVALRGDIMLGVANVDLIYVKLSVLLAAFDKVTKRDPILRSVAAGPKPRRRERSPRRHEPTKGTKR